MSGSELIEARDLILRPALSFDQRVRLAALLKMHLSDESIIESNMFQTAADVRFMSHYFPGDRYQSSPITTGALAKYGHTIAAACRGDYASLATEALVTAARHGVVDRVVSAVIPSSRTTPNNSSTMPAASTATRPNRHSATIATIATMAIDQEKRDAIKREIRLLALARNNLLPNDRDKLIRLLNAHHRKGPVTYENYVYIALNFLRVYYPDDFENEKKHWKESLQPTSRTPHRRESPQAAPFVLSHLGPPLAVPAQVRLPFVVPLAAAVTQPISAPSAGGHQQDEKSAGQNLQNDDSCPLPPAQLDEESDTSAGAQG